MNRKLAIYAGLGLFLFAGVAATRVPADDKPGWRNLKVMPRNTDEEQMERVMTKFGKALSVPCNYCHAKTKPDVFPVRIDFASDEKPQKRIARNMMRMTDRLNRKYFNYKNL